MKKSFLTITILIGGFLVGSVLITSCANKKTEQQEQKEEGGHEHHDEMDSTATAYACPMHAEVTGKEDDKCSKCGMRLEAVKATDSTAHKDHAH